MPGQSLSIPYPVLGESIASALAKLINALQVIQSDVEPKVLGSEIQWLADFSASGHALTDLSKVQLDNLAVITGLETGTLFFSGGELCAQTPSGIVQITLNGDINAASVGGIVGDYGGSNPARVTYTDGTDTYTFTGDTNDWSNVEVQALKLRNSNNWHTVQAFGSSSGAHTWTLGDMSVGGTGILRQSVSGLVDSFSTVTRPITTSASVVFTGSGKIQHGVRSRSVRATAIAGTTFTNFTVGQAGITATATASGQLEVPLMEEWERVTGFTVHMIKNLASSTTVTPRQILPTGGSVTPTDIGSAASTSATGYVALSVPLTTPLAYNSARTIHLSFATLTAGEVITTVTMHFDSV